MPRGGVRAGAGRPPEEGSLREAVRVEAGLIRTLPRARSGGAPAWPLSKASARERSVWTALWKKPVAIVWEEQGAERQVAMYVRTSVEAEAPGATAALRGLLLRQENDLLLSYASFLRAGLRVTTQGSGSVVSSPAVSIPKQRVMPSARGRLRLVEDVGDQ